MSDLDSGNIASRLARHLDTVLPRQAKLLVGYSGGLDSSVLLHLVKQVRPDSAITAIHCNHGLNSKADSWEDFCQQEASRLDIAFAREKFCFESDFSEEQGRDARYAAFQKYLSPKSVLLLGHHANDQAETLLFRLFRGTGTHGLLAMKSEKAITERQIMRPLLGFSKTELKTLATEQNISWIEDESNYETDFDRNYIRNKIFPLINERWPNAVEAINSLVEILSEDQSLLSDFAHLLLQQTDFKADTDAASISLTSLLGLKPPQQRLVLRSFVDKVTHQSLNQNLLTEIRRQFFESSEDSSPVLSLGQYELQRFDSRLYLIPQCAPLPSGFEVAWNAEQPLKIDGVGRIELSSGTPENFTVRFRQGGERAKPLGRQHSQTLKKLFQEYRIKPWLRDRTPLIFYGEDIISIGDSIPCSEHRFRIIPSN